MLWKLGYITEKDTPTFLIIEARQGTKSTALCAVSYDENPTGKNKVNMDGGTRGRVGIEYWNESP